MIYDIAVIGAGMGGASLAAEVAGKASVLLLEAEDQPGYHATGRSAAFWDETYGGPGVQPLTSASGDFLAEQGLLRERGAFIVGRAEDVAALRALQADFAGTGVVLEAQGRDSMERRLPGLLPGWTDALWQPACADIDVGGLHSFYLAAARRQGVTVQTRARVERLVREEGGWHVTWPGGEARANIIVNAAGAWASEIARKAGFSGPEITPYRRTIAQLRVTPSAPDDLPLVIHAGGSFYFKPDTGGRLWLSPHDETPAPASDAAAEELDVAIAIERLSGLVDWRIEAVERRWAGLRSFATDRLPVYGFDPVVPGFFWCAGQGGFGIQTAPAAARLAAALLTGDAPHPSVAHLSSAAFSPARFCV